MLQKRLNEFVRYHNSGDGECNGAVLKRWADRHNLTPEERTTLCYFFAVTYCAESAIVMFKERTRIATAPESWAKSHKHELVFQSDRKYIKYKDSFEKCLVFWGNQGKTEAETLSKKSTLHLGAWVQRVSQWPLFGRFSAYLFLETFAWVTGAPVENTDMDWENGATATSGLLHLYGYDEAAQKYDKSRKLDSRFTQDIMQDMVEPVLQAIREAGGDDNITKVETSLCAYRKFFKGSRYNGYYLDRMLEEINTMKKLFPEISSELTQIRCELFPADYLGEIGGWEGIRPQMKKVYKEKGVIT